MSCPLGFATMLSWIPLILEVAILFQPGSIVMLLARDGLPLWWTMCYPLGSRVALKYVVVPRFSPQVARRSSQALLQKSYECIPPVSSAGGLRAMLMKRKVERWNDKGCKCHCCAI